MSEKIVWRPGEFGGANRSLLEVVIISAITDLKSETWFSSLNMNNLEVSMTINGKEVPVRDAFDRIEKRMYEMIEKKAKILYDEKFYDTSEKMDDLFEVVRKKVMEDFKLTEGDLDEY